MGFRYLGNKARIVDWILSEIQDLVPSGAHVADPMCGTATVAVALAEAGYQVTASDELAAPVLHAKARLLDGCRYDFAPVAASYEEALEALNDLGPVEGFFFEEYSAEGSPRNGCKPRAYFTGENAARIDAMRQALRAWEADGMERGAIDRLLHDLILAANRVANIAGTYGYYRSSWNKASLAEIRVRPSPLVASRTKHAVRRGKLEEIAPGIRADAVYLDPPYTKRQYGGNYHIPETLARQDEPEPAGMGGLRDWYPEYSNFCSKVHAPAAFREVLEQLDVDLIFVSYSEDGVVPADRLGEILADHGRVEKREKPLQRFRSNGGKKEPVTEFLYVIHRN